MFRRTRSGARRTRRARSGCASIARYRKPLFELLEDRYLLAAVVVANSNDVVNGNVTSIANLIATPGADGISLREAVQAANADATADEVTFSPGLNGATILLTLANGELPITRSLTINASSLAAGITINGNDPSAVVGNGIRLVNIDDGNAATKIDVTFNRLTLTGGDPNSNAGAISSRENLTIVNSTITGNNSTIGNGGAIGASEGGTLTINGSTISNNNTGSNGGGIGITNSTLVITDSTVSGNRGDSGAGIVLNETTTTITGSTISGNRGLANGGGMNVNYSTVTIVNSTISGNITDARGGGIYAKLRTGDTLTIRNSTITRNTSDNDLNGGSGGGVYLRGIAGGTGAVVLANTIIAGNTDFSNVAPDIDNTTNVDDLMITQTFTLVGNNKGSGLAAVAGLIGTPVNPVNPLLGALSNNGGPTRTHALLAGSPAINFGDPAAVAGMGGVPMFDQRSAPFTRVAGGRIDIGAFELVPPPTAPTMMLLPSSDTGMFNNDRVTNKMQPAFGGVGPAGLPVYVFAFLSDAMGNPLGDPFIVGIGTVGSDGSDGIFGNDLGVWEVTVEPLADGKYHFFARFDEPVNGPGGLTEAVGGAPQAAVLGAPTPIPDGPNGVGVATIGVGFGASITIADVNVTVNITHPNVGDLTVTLVSPSGTSILLSNQRGGTGDNFRDTVFDDAAAMSITSIVPAQNPFTGSFRPEEPLSTLFGEPANGTWRLLVIDNVDNDLTGQIDNFSFSVSPLIMVVIDTVEPNTPFLDLLDDTGRSSVDNVTKDNTPMVSMTTTDPNIALAKLMFSDNLKFRIFDRFQNSSQEVLIYDSAQDAAADNMMFGGDMFTALTQLTRTLPQLFPANPAIVNGALADGVHNLKLEVEDRAGNISHDFFLQITVDTTVPPVSFGLPDAASQSDGLAGESDSGVTTDPTTFGDRITSDTTPKLWGRAEANTIVRVYHDRNANGIIDLTTDDFLGQATAVPFDGNDAYPNGYWEITSALDLNQILGVPKDGLRRLLVTAEDVAGNPMPASSSAVAFVPIINLGVDELQIFIDTQGPQITDVTINDLTSSQYDLFDPKPSTTGYTPLVTSLTVAVRDLPARVFSHLNDVNDFLYAALQTEQALTAGNYLLVGDHVGTVAIQSIQLFNPEEFSQIRALIDVTSTSVITPGGVVGAAVPPEVGDYVVVADGPAFGQVRRIAAYNANTGQITLDIPLSALPVVNNIVTIVQASVATIILSFAAPLPDDRYTFTVRDNLVDPANNKLDGESNAVEPQEDPFFPTGDGVPGGNFVARFTIDSRPEIANYVSQHINIDINGNFIWDQPAVPVGGDETNVDISFTLPVQNANGTVGLGGFNVHDLLFAGKFLVPQGENAFVAGHFDQLAAYGFSQQLGIYRWIIDTNSDGVVTIGTDINTVQPTLGNFNVAGAIPVAGNFDNNAANGDEIGLYNAGKWYLDTNKNFVIGGGDTLLSTNLLGHPIVGDFDGDGKDDLAVFNNNVFSFNLANDGFGDANDATIVWGFPGVLDRPIAADMDQDGIDDIGLWVPRSDASIPQGVAQWYFLISNDFAAPGIPAAHVAGSIAKINHAFTPVPFGKDIFTEFGDQLSLPVVGNFDPPIAAESVGSLAGDYDGNGRVENADVMVWRSNYGSTTNMAADGNHDGKIDSADYVVWRNNLGAVAAAGAGSTANASSSADPLAGWTIVESPELAVAAAAVESPADESTSVGEASAVAATDAVAVDDFFARLYALSISRSTTATLSAAAPVWENDDLLLATLAAPAGDAAAANSAPTRADDRHADDDLFDELLAEFAGVGAAFE